MFIIEVFEKLSYSSCAQNPVVHPQFYMQQRAELFKLKFGDPYLHSL
jgi:hypothetical protein